MAHRMQIQNRILGVRRIAIQGIALVVLAATALVGLTTLQLTRERADVVRYGSAQLSNLSASLLLNAENSVQKSSAILMGMMDGYRFGGSSPENLVRMRALARKQSALYPEIQGIFFYDANGRWILTSLDEKTAQRNNSDRGYFQHHRDTRGDAPYIGPPIQSRTTGEWIITITHRYADEAGEFAGVALATIGVQHYLDFFKQLSTESSVINVVRTDGSLLIRSPFDSADLSINFSASPAAQAIKAGAATGVLTFNSIVDAKRRVLAYSSSESLPIYVSVGVSEKEFLSAWRRSAALTATVVFVALLVILMLAWRTYASLRARLIAEREVMEANRQLSGWNVILEALASEDALTRLANRRQFDLVLSKTAIQAEITGETLSLLLMDIDHFKSYNDLYGHPAGDHCLRRVSEIVRTSLQRATDMPARYGGEELAVVLPHTDIEGAQLVATRICKAVEAANLTHAGSAYGVVTVSVGVATCGLDSECSDYEGLIKRADLALYTAKREGRNRVSSSDER